MQQSGVIFGVVPECLRNTFTQSIDSLIYYTLLGEAIIPNPVLWRWAVDSHLVDQPILIAQSGPLNGKRWDIFDGMTIGREKDCDLVIPDRQVSRYHARFEVHEDRTILHDLSSKNGTYRNGKRVEEPVVLQDGDVVQIALVQYFVYLSSDSTLPLGTEFELPIEEAKHEFNKRLVLDKRSRRVWVNGEELLPPLSVPQFRLLEALYDNAGKVVSRQDLVVAVWGDEEAVGVSEQALDALVRRLRDRLAVLDPNHAYLVTVRGYGLRLDNPPSAL
jgi:DNA-binding winged helix-turn-helix (wHTH) protein